MFNQFHCQRDGNGHIRIFIRQKQIDDLLLCKKRLTRTGNAGNKAVAVEQFSAIDHDHILADGVVCKVDTVSVRYFLHSERHKHGKRFGCECSSHRELRDAIRKNGVESFKLLPTQDIQGTQVLSRTLTDRLGIGIKLFLCICRMHKILCRYDRVLRRSKAS